MDMEKSYLKHQGPITALWMTEELLFMHMALRLI